MAEAQRDPGLSDEQARRVLVDGDPQARVAVPVDREAEAGWTVWRQDDNGNRYEVSRHSGRAEAEAVAATMESRGHKQLYWVAPTR